MAPKYNHPFMDGLKNAPEGKNKDVQKIRSWMNSQAHLPNISDEYVHLFLHACYYQHDKTKSAIEYYFTIRANHPSIFGNRDPYHSSVQTVLNMGYLIRLPQLTQEGYKILLYAVKDNDPTKMIFSDCVKGFCMYNDCVLSEEGLQEGYVVIFDMKGVQLGHLARVSLPALRCFMLYIQEAHPCRLKGIHILNTASWIHHVMRLIVPLVRSDLLNMVQFHKGNVPEGIPLELLPSDYGGQAPSMEELDSQTKALADKYRNWLIETEDWKSDESKRVKKTTWWGLFNGSNKTSNVELDEKTILKNLQID